MTNRLEAMKIAKQQAMMREKAAQQQTYGGQRFLAGPGIIICPSEIGCVVGGRVGRAGEEGAVRAYGETHRAMLFSTYIRRCTQFRTSSILLLYLITSRSVLGFINCIP